MAHCGNCVGPYGDSWGKDVQLLQQPCDGPATQQFRLRRFGNEGRPGTPSPA
ncbi:RICIN domain-containing protein [Streptomyces subrutilus]|uniref:RICIN domain-containing protein n=1 Tax=Streptomyces subrutilus TaxID=36818 RepID=UPI0033DBACFF